MDIGNLKRLRKKRFFSTRDVQDIFNINAASSRVLCTRYVQKGIFLRLKKDMYVLEDVFEYMTGYDMMILSNYIQVPSYVSFCTALAYYELTTQVQQGYYECAAVKRSVQYEVEDRIFVYHKVREGLFCGFEKKEDLFIALPEKALLDTAYLCSLGRYNADFSAIDFEKVDWEKVESFSADFPKQTRLFLEKTCRI